MRKSTWMKKTVLAAAIAFMASPSVWADEYVHGYLRSNGTYVQPHWRSNPDGTPYNNWGFPGNINPHTGQRATGSADSYLRNPPPRLWGGGSR